MLDPHSAVRIGKLNNKSAGDLAGFPLIGHRTIHPPSDALLNIATKDVDLKLEFPAKHVAVNRASLRGHNKVKSINRLPGPLPGNVIASFVQERASKSVAIVPAQEISLVALRSNNTRVATPNVGIEPGCVASL